MTAPERNIYFVFPRVIIFAETKSGKTLGLKRKQNTYLPRLKSLSVLRGIATKTFKQNIKYQSNNAVNMD